ncbi:BQ2448_3810 [Microbotryum intermedium]|uniref:BQ2448_3810 protein n=1 Tax=Microbotryum intermedium TaxID=269621 RepID=A0A238FIN8_9BASI|nr:BQ2448_3810 [Microbotryum intermedium]
MTLIVMLFPTREEWLTSMWPGLHSPLSVNRVMSAPRARQRWRWCWGRLFFGMKLIANLQDEKNPYGTKGGATQYAR